MKVAVGVAPENATDYNDEIEQQLRKAAAHKDVRAIGSCGVHDANDQVQVQVFERQVALAGEEGLKLVVEASGAYDAAYDVIAAYGFPFDKVLLRAFDGTHDELARWAGAGASVSFDARAANQVETLVAHVESLPANLVFVESGAPSAELALLAGEPPRTDQSVFVADAIIARVSAAQLAQNAADFFLS